MSSCPTRVELERFLRGALTSAESAPLEEHLAACVACRQTLNTLAGGSEPCLRTDSPLYDPVRSSRLQSVIARLKARGCAMDSSALPGTGGIPLPLRLLGDYELLEELGRGGMGVVYRARQVKLQRQVALKVILAGQLASATQVRRFQVEAEAAAKLDHPNIVPIFEIGEHLGHHFFSMKLVDGPTLAQAICRQNPPSGKPEPEKSGATPPLATPTAAARLVATIARAVHYAHQRGVLHRDLKPGNILLDREAHAHVTDFGLARLLERDSSLTHSVAVMGSPDYMPPEQAAGQAHAVTTAADIYSLGAILYELLAGRPPFQADSPAMTIRLVLESEPVSPTVHNRTAPPDLATICLKCLEKEPSRRYPTAGALAEDLERFCRDEPILARPATALEKIWRWARRNPAVASLAVAAFLFLMLGFAGVVWQWRRAERTAERETREHQRAETHALAEARQRQRAEAEELSGRRHLYAAHVNLARRAWEEGNARRALELLEVHCPKPGQEDLRGFEWYYLWELCQQAGRSWSPTGVASPLPEPHWHPAFALKADRCAVVLQSDHLRQAFAASKPLRAAPTISNDYVVVIQNLTTGKTLGSVRFPTGTGLAPVNPWFSPDGRYLVLSCETLTEPDQRWRLALWETSAILDTSEHSIAPSSWAETFPSDLDPESQRRLWLLGPGAPAVEPNWLSGSGGNRIECVVFAGDGRWVAGLEEQVAGVECFGALTIWNLATKAAIATLGPFPGFEWRPDLSRDRRVLSITSRTAFSTNWTRGTRGGRPAITTTLGWDTDSWKPVTNPPTSAVLDHLTFITRSNAVEAINAPLSPSDSGSLDEIRKRVGTSMTSLWRRGRAALSPDETSLALANGRAVEWWDLRTGRLVRTFAGHTEEVVRVDFLPDARTIVSAGKDGYVRLWNLTVEEAALVYSLPAGPGLHGVRNFSLFPDGNSAVLEYTNNRVVITNLVTGGEKTLRSTNEVRGGGRLRFLRRRSQVGHG